jgi:hypothetical protein
VFGVKKEEKCTAEMSMMLVGGKGVHSWSCGDPAKGQRIDFFPSHGRVKRQEAAQTEHSPGQCG